MGTGETERNSEKQARKEEIGPRASLTSRDPRHPESTSELGAELSSQGAHLLGAAGQGAAFSVALSSELGTLTCRHVFS